MTSRSSGCVIQSMLLKYSICRFPCSRGRIRTDNLRYLTVPGHFSTLCSLSYTEDYSMLFSRLKNRHDRKSATREVRRDDQQRPLLLQFRVTADDCQRQTPPQPGQLAPHGQDDESAAQQPDHPIFQETSHDCPIYWIAARTFASAGLAFGV